MTLFGITLRLPTSTEAMVAAVMGSGLWVGAMGLLRLAAVSVDRYDAGALLIVMLWGCFSARLGIRIEQGHRHLLANLCVSGALLLVYQAAWAAGG
jgi:hypothetical protein